MCVNEHMYIPVLNSRLEDHRVVYTGNQGEILATGVEPNAVTNLTIATHYEAKPTLPSRRTRATIWRSPQNANPKS